jgi:hypothetical protein
MKITSACLLTGASVFLFLILIIGVLLLIIINPFKKVYIRPNVISRNKAEEIKRDEIIKEKTEMRIIYLGKRIKKDINVINAGEYIELGDYIRSENSKYYFRLNNNGSLCLTETHDGKNDDINTCALNKNKKVKYGLMTECGNFILTDRENNIIFTTNTNSKDSYVKILNDGIIGVFNKENEIIYTFVGDLS